jgi:cleavage and polyadenylation specificity factor subunit 4
MDTFDFESEVGASHPIESNLFSRVQVTGLETTARDKKHKREVCRYWLHAKCMKGRDCEFLHALDYQKMPVCPMGDTCTAGSECPFKHLDPERPECSNYQLGFCSFGRRCPHRHVMRDASELPTVSAYWTDAYSAHARIQKMSSQTSFRRKECEYFSVNQWCPYFDMCNFSHIVK